MNNQKHQASREWCLEDKLGFASSIYVGDFPEAIGVFYMELDCGCMKLRGLSDEGEPFGPIMWFSVQGTCQKCAENPSQGFDRHVDEGIMWVEGKNGAPGLELRRMITQKFFGTGVEFIEGEPEGF